MKKQIALIGFGTIGQHLFRQLNTRNDVTLTGVFEANPATAQTIPDNLALNVPELFTQMLVDKKVDLVIETATQQAVKDLAPAILQHSDMVVFSSTAFADEPFETEALRLCHRFARKIYIPHGAILGLDGIRDGREILESVTITTTKKPENLGRTDRQRTVLYEGPTRAACSLFPRNVNVHASIAIAGLGFDKTCSRIIADPDSEGNAHVIEILAAGVKFKIELCSRPLGLVTGAYTPVSAYNSVCKILNQEGFNII